MTTLEAETRRGSKFGVLLTASLVSSRTMLDSNVVAVALPTIGRSLHASFAGIQWIVSAYVLMPGTRESLQAAGLSAFAGGLVAASLLAAIVALIVAILTFLLVESTAPEAGKKRPCKFIDCGDLL
jgi:hypothetical protein